MKKNENILEEMLSLWSALTDKHILDEVSFVFAQSWSDGKFHAAPSEGGGDSTGCPCGVKDLTLEIFDANAIFSQYHLWTECFANAEAHSSAHEDFKTFRDLKDLLISVSKFNVLNCEEISSFEDLLVLTRDLIRFSAVVGSLHAIDPVLQLTNPSSRSAISLKLINLYRHSFATETLDLLGRNTKQMEDAAKNHSFISLSPYSRLWDLLLLKSPSNKFMPSGLFEEFIEDALINFALQTTILKDFLTRLRYHEDNEDTAEYVFAIEMSKREMLSSLGVDFEVLYVVHDVEQDDLTLLGSLVEMHSRHCDPSKLITSVDVTREWFLPALESLKSLGK